MPDFPSPLPLAAFEEYMLWDDRPKYPMSIIARLRFAGELDRRAAAEALETGCRTPSSAACQVRKTRAGRLDWVADGRSSPGNLMDRRPDRRSLARDAADRPFLRTGPEGLGHSGFAKQFAGAPSPPRCLRRQGRVAGSRRLPASLRPRLCEGKPVRRSNCRPAIRRPCRGGGRFGLTVGKFLRMLPAQLIGSVGRVAVPHADAGSPLGASRRQSPANCRRAFRT